MNSVHALIDAPQAPAPGQTGQSTGALAHDQSHDQPQSLPQPMTSPAPAPAPAPVSAASMSPVQASASVPASTHTPRPEDLLSRQPLQNQHQHHQHQHQLQQQQHHHQQHHHHHQHHQIPMPSTPSTTHFAPISSPPLRQDTSSSVSTQATTGTLASTETNNTSYSADTSPNLHQSIFSLKDGSDVSNTRRTSRRRTGPLSQQSRERAALIRKLGACGDCRRRRVAVSIIHSG